MNFETLLNEGLNNGKTMDEMMEEIQEAANRAEQNYSKKLNDNANKEAAVENLMQAVKDISEAYGLDIEVTEKSIPEVTAALDEYFKMWQKKEALLDKFNEGICGLIDKLDAVIDSHPETSEGDTPSKPKRVISISPWSSRGNRSKIRPVDEAVNIRDIFDNLF